MALVHNNNNMIIIAENGCLHHEYVALLQTVAKFACQLLPLFILVCFNVVVLGYDVAVNVDTPFYKVAREC